ncbi:MAG: flagellar hook-basal body protein [Oscillospiraceae bacterium]|jgi:flagellar basal-body rod protein FlgG|nr:flagellar hook-basal body protein [Oscillospiraceae bacterium]
MNISFYTGRSGLISQQEGLNIYANNIANINTVGFKAMRPSFAECLYVRYRSTEPQWETGHGQYLMKTDLMWQEGMFTATDQPLDFALPNDGFFMVSDRYQNTYLTRDGAFSMTYNEDAEVWQLVSAAGEYVLDYDGNSINIPFEVITDEDGNETVTSIVDYAVLETMIGVFTVPNNWGLDNMAGNRFAVTERSGAAAPAPEYDKVRMALELSTTDLAGDMVRIIETQRAYQLAAKIVQTSDEFIRIANNLRS